jgi:competence protein ComGC
MWKTKKFIVAMVLVAVVLVGGTAGVALAQGPEGKPGSSGLMARVAEILGINQQDLENAFKQAASEQRKQMSESRLQSLVDEGKITQQQADALETWQAAKPDVPRLGGWLIVGGEKADALLQKLLADGKITQAQVDAYKKWLETRPDVQLPTPEGGKRPGRGFFPGQRPAPQSIPFGPRTGSTI